VVQPLVLLVDDDETALSLGSRLLELEGHRVLTARTGSEARSLLVLNRPDIALLDLRLPDESGLELLPVVRAVNPSAACIIVTGYATCRVAVDAMRLGAVDVIEKPLYGDALLDVVRHAATFLQSGGSVERHAFRRWAELVARGVASPSDPRTLAQWGRIVGASRGALRSWCQVARISPRRSLLFTRLLRAVIRHQQTQAGYEQLLDVVDRRTLMKLAVLSGSGDGVFPRTVEAFFAQQRLVTEPDALEQLVAISQELSAARRDMVSPFAADATVLGNGVLV
jgi:FixJ family two-component response regulator